MSEESLLIKMLYHMSNVNHVDGKEKAKKDYQHREAGGRRGRSPNMRCSGEEAEAENVGGEFALIAISGSHASLGLPRHLRPT